MNILYGRRFYVESMNVEEMIGTAFLSLLWSCQQAIVTDFFVNCSEENEGK
jgi:hypothetical protein